MQIGPIEVALDWIWLNATFFIPDWHLKEKISAQKWGLKMAKGGKKTSFSWKKTVILGPELLKLWITYLCGM